MKILALWLIWAAIGVGSAAVYSTIRDKELKTHVAVLSAAIGPVMTIVLALELVTTEVPDCVYNCKGK